MKRIRQPDLLDEEPLSKRINNLHLDNSCLSSPNSSPEQVESMVEAHFPPHALHPASFPYDTYNAINSNNNNNDFVKDAHLISQISSNMSLLAENVNLQPNVMHTYHSLHKMIEERSFPESLSANYPTANPTNNNYYYNFNRMLHTLHLERLRRQGKI